VPGAENVTALVWPIGDVGSRSSAPLFQNPLPCELGFSVAGVPGASLGYVAIGSNTTGWLRYDGAMDEVATYTRALSAAEVAEHWRIGTTGR